MNKFNKEAWKERQLDEKLQDTYGENWRVIKRSIVQAQRVSKATPQPHAFSHLLGKRHPLKPLGDPQIRRI